MFELGDRRSLTAALAPPPGYSLEAAIATTYSLDFVALTAALGALASDVSRDATKAAPDHVIRALFGVRDKVTVFVHQAQIHRPGPSGPHRLYGLYDSCT